MEWKVSINNLNNLFYRSEPFWIIVDNDSEILHSEFFVLHKNDTIQKKGKKNFKNEQEY
jgi:hypothetical protein